MDVAITAASALGIAIVVGGLGVWLAFVRSDLATTKAALLGARGQRKSMSDSLDAERESHAQTTERLRETRSMLVELARKAHAAGVDVELAGELLDDAVGGLPPNSVRDDDAASLRVETDAIIDRLD